MRGQTAIVILVSVGPLLVTVSQAVPQMLADTPSPEQDALSGQSAIDEECDVVHRAVVQGVMRWC
jgi:hypothetical protein